MLQYIPKMINNFPGSDDSRGTTTRIYYSIPQPVTDNLSPEMRPDEFPGTLGDALKSYNLTRQTISIISNVSNLDTASNLNSYFRLSDQDAVTSAIADINDTINSCIEQVCDDLGVPVYTFVITKVDILSTSVKLLHGVNGNQAGKGSILWNYDAIFYGQFAPSPLIQPAPEPQTCVLFTGASEIDAGFNPPFGTFRTNDAGPAWPVLGQVAMNILPRIQNGTVGSAFFNTPYTANTTYTFIYTIPAYSFSGPNPGGIIRFAITINGISIGIFSLSKSIQNGSIAFTTTSAGSQFTFEMNIVSELASPTTAVKDFGGDIIFQLGNSFCAS
jgi:hypothetical protein